MTAAELRDRLHAAIRAHIPAPEPAGAPRLAPDAANIASKMAAEAGSHAAARLGDRPPVPAAVLVPFVLGREPGILLTRRTAHLSSHAGQVSFPGGRIDPEDSDADAAALREAHEEIGLAADQVEIIGRLPDQLTGTGYRITPVLGLLPEGREFDGLGLVASAHEVAAMFVLPLSVLLDPRAPQRRRAELRGKMREFWVWPHAEHDIWGATASILVTLATRLRETEPSMGQREPHPA